MWPWDEAVDLDLTRLDGGAALNPNFLVRDPRNGCRTIMPHQYVRVNTIFEVVRAHGGLTAWTDKHPSGDPNGRRLILPAPGSRLSAAWDPRNRRLPWSRPPARAGTEAAAYRRIRRQRAFRARLAEEAMRVPKNQPFGLRLRYALAGIAAGVRSEHSLRIQLVTLAAAIIFLCIFRPEPIWWAAIALSSGMVISAELLNTAIEHLADHLHPEIHPEIQIVKDCAAAAVLIASLGAFAVGIALVVHVVMRH